MRAYEADLCVSMVASPPGSPERPAVTMFNEELGVKFVFFLSREEGHYLAEDIQVAVGYDS